MELKHGKINLLSYIDVQKKKKQRLTKEKQTNKNPTSWPQYIHSTIVGAAGDKGKRKPCRYLKR